MCSDFDPLLDLCAYISAYILKPFALGLHVQRCTTGGPEAVGNRFRPRKHGQLPKGLQLERLGGIANKIEQKREPAGLFLHTNLCNVRVILRDRRDSEIAWRDGHSLGRAY
jgi:hypothetical protein